MERKGHNSPRELPLHLLEIHEQIGDRAGTADADLDYQMAAAEMILELRQQVQFIESESGRKCAKKEDA